MKYKVMQYYALLNFLMMDLTSSMLKFIEFNTRDVKFTKIMLTDAEWDVINDLKSVLQPFSEATDLLGGSNYCTFSMMNPILISIKKRFCPLTSRGFTAAARVDFTNDKTAFDDNIFIEDEDEEVTLTTNTSRKIKINQPVNCTGLVDKVKLNLYAAMDHY